MIPFIKLTKENKRPVWLKATNILSIDVFVKKYTNAQGGAVGSEEEFTKVTINHAEFIVKESPEEVIKMIQDITKNVRFV